MAKSLQFPFLAYGYQKLLMLSNSCLNISANICICHVVHNGFSVTRAKVACAILNRTLSLRPSYGTTTPRYLKLVIIRNISHFALISLRDSLTLFIIGLVILALISFPYFVFVSSGLSSSISNSCSSSAKISSLSANWRLVKVLQPVLPFQASRNIQYSIRVTYSFKCHYSCYIFSWSLTSSSKS